MPFPIVTCLLVLGCVVAAADTLTGAAIIFAATAFQFLLVSSPEPAAPPGVPDEDTYSI